MYHPGFGPDPKGGRVPPFFMRGVKAGFPDGEPLRPDQKSRNGRRAASFSTMWRIVISVLNE